MTLDPLSLADEIEAALWGDVAEPWFPRCIDPPGGYHENFAVDWSPIPETSRSLVFQSRMIWFTAQMGELRPEFKDYCHHGLAYYKSAILGGDGLPKGQFGLDGTDQKVLRSVYGLAFAIFALANATIVLEDDEPLELALNLFHYLERHHKAPVGRGYFEYTSLDGSVTPFEDRGETASSLFKHQNPHLHLLEAFTDLYRIWPDPHLRLRLTELVEFFTEELFSEPGYLKEYVTTDGISAGKQMNFGHDVEVAHLLVSAAEALGDVEVRDTACRLVLHAMREGWDHQFGGMWSGKTAGGEMQRTKIWWVQMENLIALASFPDEPFSEKLADQWAWIRDHQIDSQHRGLYGLIDENGRPSGRLTKGNTWKAAYHDGRAFLKTPKLLRAKQ